MIGIRQVTPYIKSDYPKMVQIAPAPENYELDTEKTRYTYKSNPYTGAQAASIARRNARERNRVKQVNDGFNALRKRLPPSVVAALSGGARRGCGKKLSKVDTLRMVVEYIRHLETLLDEGDSQEDTRMAVTDFSYEDEGILSGGSPYSESVPSPVSSECSSGVSSNYSSVNYYNMQNYQVNTQAPSADDELFEAMSWWQK